MKTLTEYNKATARRIAELAAGGKPWPAKTDESSIDKLRRIVHWFDHENDGLLQDLPTTAAVEEFFDLQYVYDTDFLEGILEAISEGDDPSALQTFITKHQLDWTIPVAESDDE